MSTQFRRNLRHFLLALLIIPILHLIGALLLTIRAGEPDLLFGAINRLRIEAILLSGLLRAVITGRHPTIAERLTSPYPLEFLISVLVCWFSAALGLFTLWRLFTKLRPRILYRLAISILATLLFLWLITAREPIAPYAHITIDATAKTSWTFSPSFSQGGEIEMMTAGFFEGGVEKLAALHPQFIRIDHLFDYYDVLQPVSGSDGQFTYQWSELDRIVDAIIATGAQPFICLSYLPSELAPNTAYGAPSDWQTWEELIYQTVYHFNIERKLDIRYWEVWNEPNLPAFWSGSLDDYLRLYEITTRAAKRADPSIKIGGPATSSLDRSLSLGAAFYEQNWITELARFTQQRQLPLDFVSWHYYDPDPQNFVWNVQQHVDWLREAGFTDETMPALMLTEWNSAGGFTPNYDTAVNAAFAIAILASLEQTPLSQHFLFEPMDGSKKPEGRWGMLYADASAKPTYRAFLFASQLNGMRLQVTSDHPNVGVLAVQDEAIKLLLWNTGDNSIIVTIWLQGISPNQTIRVNYLDFIPTLMVDPSYETQSNQNGIAVLPSSISPHSVISISVSVDSP